MIVQVLLMGFILLANYYMDDNHLSTNQCFFSQILCFASWFKESMRGFISCDYTKIAK